MFSHCAVLQINILNIEDQLSQLLQLLSDEFFFVGFASKEVGRP